MLIFTFLLSILLLFIIMRSYKDNVMFSICLHYLGLGLFMFFSVMFLCQIYQYPTLLSMDTHFFMTLIDKPFSPYTMSKYILISHIVIMLSNYILICLMVKRKYFIKTVYIILTVLFGFLNWPSVRYMLMIKSHIHTNGYLLLSLLLRPLSSITFLGMILIPIVLIIMNYKRTYPQHKRFCINLSVISLLIIVILEITTFFLLPTSAFCSYNLDDYSFPRIIFSSGVEYFESFSANMIIIMMIILNIAWMEKFYDYSFNKKWDLKKFHIEEWMHSRECKYSFLSAMRRFGFHVALWMCMDYDLCDHEEGLAGGESKLVAWYEHVKKFVDDGVDGFKIDPADMLMRINPNTIYTNGESELKMHNVSQVLAMKQMHEGFTKQMNIRPFIHYCGGYTGQQRFGAATTGDNDGLLGSMIWLENLAMSGFMNSTVDMDVFSVEAIHFAMLAPWAHHNAWMGVSQPWYAGEDNEQAYTYYARLRYSILPYIYSLAIKGHEDATPIIRPMMLEYQNDKNCQDLSRQYMIGPWILISAFTDTVYLPRGRWIDFWTGTEYDGNITIENYTPPKGKGGAFFIKKGAIIPKWCDRDYTSQYGEEEIELHFYPDGKTEYIFREDDGISLDYLDRDSCHTKIECDATGDEIIIKIGDRMGDYQNKPENRLWKVFVHDDSKKVKVICSETFTIC